MQQKPSPFLEADFSSSEEKFSLLLALDSDCDICKENDDKDHTNAIKR